jgi:hypothetical protein
VRKCAPIRPRRRHRVKRIGDSNDPCAERDPVAEQPGGIAGPVEMLVMVAHHRAELTISQASNDVGTLVSVALDDFKLIPR